MMQLAWVQEIPSLHLKMARLRHINPVSDHVRSSLALAVGGQGSPRRELDASRSQASLREVLGGWRDGKASSQPKKHASSPRVPEGFVFKLGPVRSLFYAGVFYRRTRLWLRGQRRRLGSAPIIGDSS